MERDIQPDQPKEQLPVIDNEEDDWPLLREIMERLTPEEIAEHGAKMREEAKRRENQK